MSPLRPLALACFLALVPGEMCASAMEDLANDTARSAGVPRELVLAMAYAESRFDANQFGDDVGWIHLVPWRTPRGARLAAELLNESVEGVQANPMLGLRGAVALIAKIGREKGIGPKAPVSEWRAALEVFNGGGDPLGNQLYADQVVALASAGFWSLGPGRHPVILPGDARYTFSPIEQTRPSEIVGASYAPYFEGSAAGHRPLDPKGRTVKYIVIHTMQNLYSQIFDYFRRPTTKVGAHYMIRGLDGLTVQMADERLVVFHDACFNEESIGIEHEGYVGAGTRWYSDEMYAASARLVRDIAARYQVPLDREHILGHGETKDCSDHTDPGPLWDWDRFMASVRQ